MQRGLRRATPRADSQRTRYVRRGHRFRRSGPIFEMPANPRRARAKPSGKPSVGREDAWLVAVPHLERIPMRIWSSVPSIALTLLLSAVLVCALAAGAGAALSASSGAASFAAVGPAGLRIEGKTSEVIVVEQHGIVRVTVALSGLDTGISLRNRHMREKYLETDKYPIAELEVPRAALQIPDDGKPASAVAEGSLTLHGQTRKVSFSYRAHRTLAAFDVEGTTKLNMRDYGVQVPSYLGITVKPEVEVNVRFQAKDP